MQTLGQIAGPFISANLYLLLSSDEFCKNSLGLSSALLNYTNFTRFLGSFTLFATFFAFIIVKEDVNVEEAEITLNELLIITPKIVIHKNTKYELLIGFLFQLLHYFMGSVYVLRLLSIGFKKEEIGMFDSYMIVADILVVFSMGLIDINENLWKYYKLSNTTIFCAVKLSV